MRSTDRSDTVPTLAMLAHDAAGGAGIGTGLALDDAVPIVVRLIGSDQRVLLVGSRVDVLAQALRQSGSQVTVVTAATQEATEPLHEHVVVEAGEVIDLRPAFVDDRFDVAVVVDVLTRLHDPLRLIREVVQAIKPHGRLIVAVPNAAHGAVRLEFVQGRSPYTTGILGEHGGHLFTRDVLIALCERAGLALGRLERQELPMPSSPAELERLQAPLGLLETLRQDPDAHTARFIAVAYPLPNAELGFIQKRMRDLALAAEAAQREAAALRAAAHGRPLPTLSVAHQPASLEIRAADSMAVPPGADLATLQQTVREQTEHIEALTARLEAAARREIELRDRLIEAHDQLLRRDDDIQFMWRGQGWPAPPSTFYARVRAVYARFQWVPGIRLPLRLIRGLRRMVPGHHGRR